MYLRKIEAQGFKSFANRTTLEFAPGIMGIVGPNGSGKSNVADAVRWVLGEQSAKQLRGLGMQDVIFAGTQHRKALGFAGVTLTIDNSDRIIGTDLEEIVVTRRVYRSGESEYVLNGTPCRLKDIHALFDDTGVGREGYSIIGQGKIDRVLSVRPEDRRELFDEAAGIIKYKKRKAIAQKKLESEEHNILRVSDILNELEKQVGPLERQSGRARQYLKWKAELREYEIGAYFLESGDIENKRQEVIKSLAIAREQLEKTGRLAQKAGEEQESAAKKIAGQEDAIAVLDEGISAGGIEKSNLEGAMALLKEQLKIRIRDDATRQERMEALKGEISENASAAALAKAELEQTTGRLGTLNGKLVKMTDEAGVFEENIRTLEAESADLRSRHIALMEKKTALMADSQRAGTELDMIRRRREDAEKSEDADRTRLEGLEKELNALEARITHNTSQKQEKERERGQLEKRLEDTKNLLKSLYAGIDQDRKSYHMQKSRLDTLEGISERYEGYVHSVRAVMERRKSEPGIRGVVADIFNVPEQYETAIETALGGRIQNIVTDNLATARRMVDVLKKTKSGRATFLPLSDIRQIRKFSADDALKEKGALGIASGLISCDAQYEKLAGYLLGHILVADNVQNASAIAAKYGFSMHIVTLEGEYFAPGGTLSGGAYKNSQNFLGRPREISSLRSEIKRLESDIEKKQDGIVENTALKAGLQEKLSDANKVITSLLMENAALEKELESVRLQKEALAKRTKKNKDDEKKLKKSLEELEASVAGFEQKVTETDGHLRNVLESMESAGNKIASLRESAANTAAGISSIREDISALSEKETHIREELFRLGREKDRMESELNPSGPTMKNADDAATIQEKIKEKNAQIEALSTRLEKMRQERDSLFAENEGLKARSREAVELRISLTNDIARMDKEVFRLDGLNERYSNQLENLKEYLWTEYEITPSQAKEQGVRDKRSLKEMRRDIARKKEQIRELGPVNVNAIEEFAEVSERCEFMRRQHSDLVMAKQSLLSVIDDLDKAMRKQFLQSFADIQREFATVFSELFGGGRGTLELADNASDDILEAGITINAQPPGKRLQNMMQLSGGEKALTAIALLFAIQNLKPSPFCLLDEIEAALDEPNVLRFAQYLDRLKDRTQFIVITHRRGTMEKADRLYGITMQEKGVSVVVSVDLTDDAKAV